MAHPAAARSRAADVEHPPTRLLVVAAISVALGAVFLAFDEFALNVIGYFLASFQTIGLLAAYTRIDAGLRQHAGYVPLQNATRITSALALAGVIVAAANVWFIATELAG
jgi:hypothetical protein